MLNKFRNKDGTYNGAAALSEFCGIPQEEIVWMFNRSKELYAQGLTKSDVLRIIKEERNTQPWKNKNA